MTRTAVRHSPTLVFLFIGVADVVLAFISQWNDGKVHDLKKGV